MISWFYFSYVLGLKKKRFAVSAQHKISQSTIQYAGLLGRWDKQLVDQESDVPSVSYS